MDQWMQEEIESLIAKHGSVPPPWVMYDEHPCSIYWRMGSGESHNMVWWKWWEVQNFTEVEKIAYFRQWPPPHCWLSFLIQAVWNIDTFDEEENLAPYFEHTRDLGFGSQQDYEGDLNDPKWLEL